MLLRRPPARGPRAVRAGPRVRDGRLGASPEPRVTPIRRPVLRLLARVAMRFTIVEGASSDWSALSVVTTQHIDQGGVALVFTAFSAATTLPRLGGAWAQNGFGAIRTLAVGTSLAGVGLLGAAVVAHVTVSSPRSGPGTEAGLPS